MKRSSIILVVLVAWGASTGNVFAETTPAAPPAVPEPPPAKWSKPPSTPNDTLVSPEVSADGRVTFRLYAPEAQKVSVRVNSDFFKGPILFIKNEQGVWSATTESISSGAYRYNFMVDGATVLDCRNPSTSSGALNVQSLVEVSGGPDDIQANQPGISHGTLATVYYDSPVSKGQRRLHLYLPPGYNKGKDYPVLYLIHGGGDDDEAWPTAGRANFILDNLIAAGKAKPMVVVFPNGGVNGNLQHVSESEKDPFIAELTTVIIPYIEANYSVSKSPEDRALAGLSMGGHQTAFIGLTHTQQFRYLGIFSSGVHKQKSFEDKYGPTLGQEAARLKLIWVGYGTADPARPDGQSLQKMFDRYGIKYQSEETPGGHVWANWRTYLSHFAPQLFR
jgi:enterochelin esterase family protein